NYGSNVDIYAPGASICSTVNPAVDSGNLYDCGFSGTSMATPHVSGVAALVWASSYGTSKDNVISRILNNYDSISVSPGGNVKRLNAAKAVGTAAAQAVPTLSASTISSSQI